MNNLQRSRSISFVFFLILSVQVSFANAAELTVMLEYQGSGAVDQRHALVLIAFSDPAFTQIVQVRVAGRNAENLTFNELDADSIWLLAFYDKSGELSGLNIPVGSPMGIYSNSAGQPLAIDQPFTHPVKFAFDDQQAYPGNPSADPEPAELLNNSNNGIVEIRLYTIKEGKREEFAAFFENETLAGQQATGIRVPGIFKSFQDSNLFVWMRAFDNEKERVLNTRSFYFGDLWTSDLARKATEMIESTEVLLLEPTKHSEIR
jgi:hypothetical protein